MGGFLDTFSQQLGQLGGSFLPKLLGAIALLIIGWLVARIVANIIRRALTRTNLDNRFAQWVGLKEDAKTE
jgi:small-conductance mechanosensitive channel